MRPAGETAAAEVRFRRRVAALWHRIEPLLPRERLAEVANHHADLPFGRRKPHYIDFVRDVRNACADVVQSNLDQTSGLSVLDIGTGPGALPFLLWQLGHRVVATEVPVDESVPRKCEDPSPRSLYGDFRDTYGVRPFRWAVEARREAPAELSGFDAIFARGLYFDFKGRNEAWTPEDWRFFFGDMAARLADDASILFLSFPGRHRSLERVLDVPDEEAAGPHAVRRILTRDALRSVAAGKWGCRGSNPGPTD